MVVVVNQGGKCKGVVCVYLELWYFDIEEFLELCKNIGDDCCCMYDMNMVNWIFDLFMKCVMEGVDWMLFLLLICLDLYDKFGVDFEKVYMVYEDKVVCGEIKLFKKILVQQFWCKMFGMLFEMGYLWIMFKDLCNVCLL